jgi:hypothetical protein
MHSPAGTDVSNGQVVRSRQVGRSPSIAVLPVSVAFEERQAATPINSASPAKPQDQSSIWVRSVKNGSMAKG